VARSTVIVTDGYVSCEPEAFDLIRENLNVSNVFTFGIGSSVNRHLIEGMARSGQGEPLIVTGPDETGKKADKFREYIKEPVLTQIEIEFGAFNAYDVEPLSVPDVLANRPVIVFGKYKGTPRGSITISGYTGEGEYKAKLDISPDMEEKTNTALRYLWARHRIKTLADYNNLRQDSERVREVTNLGLTYNLLTQYTSFVAVDSLVRNQGGDQATVKQALPLPDGVSDLAVGGTLRKAAKAPMSMNYSAISKEEIMKLGASAPAEVKERDKLSIGRFVNGLVGARSSGAGSESHKMAQVPPASPGAKDGKAAAGPAHSVRGQFRSDSKVAGADERREPEVVLADKPSNQVAQPKADNDAEPSMRIVLPEADKDTDARLLLVVIPVAVIGAFLLWRRRNHHKDGAPKTDSEK
jgi:hypothetical protein